MNITKAPLILVGQVYLNPSIQEYLIVTQNNRGQISFQGNGFKGGAEDLTFLETFGPVDPTDIDPAELQQLLGYCPPGTTALVGFVTDPNEIYE